MDDDDDDDDNDSNDTDESEEIVTSFPTDIPVTEPLPTFPFTRGDNAGRGDSVGYRMRAKAALLRAKAALVKSIKLHKTNKKVNSTEQWHPYSWKWGVNLKMGTAFYGSWFWKLVWGK